ncbi:SelB C-terminal domain-containing protein [Nonomuraea longicatena]|uniref:Selenocysteine-specific translation elongation factor n=1 Tax=Nonomuraea longicatena TaxID=83682 RepID=A0ABP4AH60_9ACTN
MRVIATAGHVDHGKSTLLRALTGMEPDRLEEERRRGLSIDLGFAWTGELAFVDVPGHERFLTNMLAGVGAVPAVLFVVAADEGWREQSGEHLAAVTALGIAHGVLVITRADLADPGPALAQARERLAGTGLAGVAAVAVSARTGEGLPELRAALAALAESLPGPDPGADVRLWIDRVFTVAGHGTVVTGTLGAGALAVGDVLSVGEGGRVRVRGLHSLGRAAGRVEGPARVAVNVRGADGLRRGDVLTAPGRWVATDVLDVRLVAQAPRLPRQGVLHVGSASVVAEVRPLGGDTARLALARALPLRIGERAVLRDGGRRLWGVTALDVRPPGLRRRGAARARAAELAAMDGRPDLGAELRRRGVAAVADLAAMGVAADGPGAVRVGEWLADPGVWSGLGERLVALVRARGALEPFTVEAARRELGLPDRALAEALAEAAGRGRGARRLRARGAGLPAALERAVRELEREWARGPFSAPDSGRLAGLGLDARAQVAAEAAGRLTRLAPNVVVAPDALARAAVVLRGLPPVFTAAQARQALGTSRRVVIPLLERLDAGGVTRKWPDGNREFVRRDDI